MRNDFSKKLLNLVNNNTITHSIVSIIIKMLGVFFSYILYFIISKIGGVDDVGNFAIIQNFIQLLSQLVALGIPVAILRFAGPLVESNNWSMINRIYNNSLILIIISGLFIGSFIFFSSKPISLRLYHNEKLLVFIRLSSLGILFFVLNQTNESIIRVQGLIKLSQFFLYLVIPALTTLLILIQCFALKKILPIYTYIFVIFLSALGSLICSKYTLLKKCVNNNLTNVKNVKDIIDLLKTSLPIMVTTLVVMLTGQLSFQLLSLFCTIEDVGVYQIILKIASLTNIIQQSVNVVVGPKISNFYWNNDTIALNKILNLSSKFIFLTSFIVILLIIIFSQKILLIFGDEFIVGQIPLIVICLGQIINTACGSNGIYMNMTGKQKEFRNISLITISVSALLGIYLVKNYGILGSAINYSVTVIILNILPVLYIYKVDRINTMFSLKSILVSKY